VVPYQAFKTKDGYAVSGTWGDADWPRFCDGLGWPELADDHRYDTNVKRVERRDELSEMLQERFTDRTTAEWEERSLRESPVRAGQHVLGAFQPPAGRGHEARG